MTFLLHQPEYINEIGQRENNEDAVYPDKNPSKESRLFLVCDGVGGMEKGEVASHLVCEHVADFLFNASYVDEGTLRDAVRHAEETLSQHVLHHPEAHGMATTLTLVYFGEHDAYLAHAGDSRIYHVRKDQILFQSMDHSYVNELINQNIISEHEARNHPKRNVITRALSGSSSPQELDIEKIKDIKNGDYFFLCSDGVLECWDDVDLMHVLADQNLSNQEKISKIGLHCQMEAKDNYSGYLIQIEDVGKNAVIENKIIQFIEANNTKVIYILSSVLVALLVSFVWINWSGSKGSNDIGPSEMDENSFNEKFDYYEDEDSTVENAADIKMPFYEVKGKKDSIVVEAVNQDSTPATKEYRSKNDLE